MKKKRILSLLVAFAMVLSLVPMMAVNVGSSEPAPPAVSIELIARTTDGGTVHRSPATSVTRGQTVTLTIADIPATALNFANLAIRSAGAGFDEHAEVGTSVAVPAGFEDALVNITNVTIGTVSTTVTMSAAETTGGGIGMVAALAVSCTGGPAAGATPAHDDTCVVTNADRVSVGLWNAWSAPDRRLVAATGLNLTGEAWGGTVFARDPAAAVGTIAVTFTISEAGGAETCTTHAFGETPVCGTTECTTEGCTVKFKCNLATCTLCTPVTGGCEKDGEKTHVWTISDLTRTPADHILALPVPAALAGMNGNGTLTVNYTTGQSAGSSRRILAWTNVSGTGANDIAFLTSARTTGENGSNGVSASAALGSADTTATVALPESLLVSATTIYVSITTNSSMTAGDPFISNTNHRGGGTNLEFGRLATITLVANVACPGCDDCCPTKATPPGTCPGCEGCNPTCAHAGMTVTTAPTCIADGVGACAACEETAIAIPMLGHDMPSTPTTPATCVAAGSNACARTGCTHTVAVAINPNAHAYEGEAPHCGKTCTRDTCTNVFKCTDVNCAVCNPCETCTNGTTPPEKDCCTCGRTNPDCDNNECANIACPNASQPTLSWTINPAPQPGVARIGSTAGNMLALAKPNITAAAVPAGGVDLTVTLGERFMFRSDNRVLLIWSDLSGTPAEVTVNSFVSQANVTEGKIALGPRSAFQQTPPIIATPGASVTVNVPRSILVDAEGKVAQTIYVVLGQASGSGAETTYSILSAISDANRAAHGLTATDPTPATEFDLWKSVSLFIPCTTHTFAGEEATRECGVECTADGCKVKWLCDRDSCEDCNPPGACEHCGTGGTIKTLATAPTGSVGITNGNFSTSEPRVGLTFDVLELIKGTRITPDMIMGVEADVWRGNNTNNMNIRMWMQDEVVDPDAEPSLVSDALRSPVWARTSALPADRLPLAHAAVNTLRWMNMYAPPADNNTVATAFRELAPFVSADAERFDIEIHPHNEGPDNAFRVVAIRLLGAPTKEKCAGDDCNRVHANANAAENPIRRCDGTCLEPVVLGEIVFNAGSVLEAMPWTEAALWSALGSWSDFGSPIACVSCPHGTCDQSDEGCAECSALCTHATLEWVTITEATCQAAGSRVQQCAVPGVACNHRPNPPEAIAQIACTPGAFTQTTAPTCTVAGQRTATCTMCNTAVPPQEVAALGHEPGGWAPSVGPTTCRQAFTQTQACLRDGCTETVATRQSTPSSCGTTGCPVCLGVECTGDKATCPIENCPECDPIDTTCGGPTCTNVNCTPTTNCGRQQQNTTCTGAGCTNTNCVPTAGCPRFNANTACTGTGCTNTNCVPTAGCPRFNANTACTGTGCTNTNCVPTAGCPRFTEEDCECKNCADCGFLGGKFGLGRVRGAEGGSKPEIADALQILRAVVGLSSVLDSTNENQADALIAGNIMRRGQVVDKLEIADALQILRFVVDLSTDGDWGKTMYA